jgi:cobalt-zinc-cadmium efflux system membrane fusion protein
MAHEPLRTFLQRLRHVVNPAGDRDHADAELLQRFVQRRDEAAFEVLVWRYGGLVLSVCGRLLGSTEDIEDAFQATFLALVRRAASIGKGEALASWLYKVAYRVALRVRARLARQATQPAWTLAQLAAPTEESAAGPDVRPVLDEEINRLPARYRVPLILCYLQGKSTAEAAQQLGCARGTVCSRLAWARQRLRRCLTQRGLALSAAGLAAALAPRTAPAALVGATVKAAGSFAWGPALANGFAGPAIALAEGVVRAMVLSKVKRAFAGLLVVGLLGLGAGLCVQHLAAESAEGEEKPVFVRGSDGVRLPVDLRGKLGIQSAEVKARGMARPRVLELPGSLTIDPERLTRVRCRCVPVEVIEIGKVEGKEEDRELRPGDKVRKGQLLARLHSLEVSAKKSDLFDALVQYKLDQKIYDNMANNSTAIPQVMLDKQWRSLQTDRNAINRARNTLLVWGISEEEIEAVRKEAEEKTKRKGKVETEEEHMARLKRWAIIELKAPSDGVIVERSIVRHEILADSTHNLFQIARFDRLKVLAHVNEDDLPLLNALKPEQRRWTIRAENGGRAAAGWMESIDNLIDPNQHTAVVSGYIENPEGRWRAGQFIIARVTLSAPSGVLILPAGAVVEEGQQTFVFVQPDLKKFFYEQRRVAVIRRSQDVVHIRSQLTPEQERQGFQTVRVGERVITAGAVELKAILEDLKASADR